MGKGLLLSNNYNIKQHFYTLCTYRVDVRDLQKGFELVKSFKESASESLELMLGCHSRYLLTPSALLK